VIKSLERDLGTALLERTSKQVVFDGIADGSPDVAIVSVPGRPPSAVSVRQLLRRRLDLVVPEGHRLAGADEVRIADLADEPFVDFPPGYGNRIVVDRAFSAAGVGRRVAIDIGAGADFVRAGLGIAILPHFTVRDPAALILKRVIDADLDWPLGIAMSAARAPSAAARALVDLIAEMVA
jgi:DNA-binding transcriptional LysR family regulator